ncbi:ROK family transcriptional regulator [Demequina sp. TTPB684]|uniref:ROK family transcriptional regulator n=1 Tax=unclassified Demequina TaxID=2620311 RepID=UPI001CF4E233|nr:MULTISPECIES: ROK family transcriptional regulator [unclassified Demequina]MCB2411712.1 ROK family transcriptional regulator [Demequina sp. TTPB684]UPU88485.1 ROK family transcriptional regulator [Demequina sp. TMPB413]
MSPVQSTPTEPESRAGNAPTRRRALAATVRAGARLTPEHARRHNRALVLQALYRGEGLSRADLAREVGLTRVTISDLVADLIAEGIVVELGVRADSRPGKPATVLDLDRRGFNVIAIDLSKDAMFRGAVTDLDGTVLHRHEVDVMGLTGSAAVDAVIEVLDALAAATSVPVLGVGVGSPGIVDAKGVVLQAPNLGWADVPLQELLTQHTGLAVLVANDANAAALAERTFGTGEDDMMLVRIGRGVGAGLVVGGTLVQGANSAAGEIGHVVVGTDGGDTCACGKEGCLETWLAIPRLTERLAQAGSPQERDAILAAAGERLGIAIAPVVGALNLRDVILSGPVEILDGVLLDSAVATLRGRTLPEIHGGSELRVTALGRDIVVLGAAVMVLMGQLGVS